MHSTFRATIAFYFLRECVLIIRKHPVITQKVGILSLCSKNTGTLTVLLQLFILYLAVLKLKPLLWYFTICSHDVFKTLSP